MVGRKRIRRLCRTDTLTACVVLAVALAMLLMTAGAFGEVS